MKTCGFSMEQRVWKYLHSTGWKKNRWKKYADAKERRELLKISNNFYKSSFSWNRNIHEQQNKVKLRKQNSSTRVNQVLCIEPEKRQVWIVPDDLFYSIEICLHYGLRYRSLWNLGQTFKHPDKGKCLIKDNQFSRTINLIFAAVCMWDIGQVHSSGYCAHRC